MNILLWILQVLLAFHTLMGALWKLSHSEQKVSSLSAIPHPIWLSLSGLELLCVAGLLLPIAAKKLGKLAPAAASVIAAEMLIYCAIHLSSGEPDSSPMIYWGVVAAICGFIAYGRFKLRPIRA